MGRGVYQAFLRVAQLFSLNFEQRPGTQSHLRGDRSTWHYVQPHVPKVQPTVVIIGCSWTSVQFQFSDNPVVSEIYPCAAFLLINDRRIWYIYTSKFDAFYISVATTAGIPGRRPSDGKMRRERPPHKRWKGSWEESTQECGARSRAFRAVSVNAGRRHGFRVARLPGVWGRVRGRLPSCFPPGFAWQCLVQARCVALSWLWCVRHDGGSVWDTSERWKIIERTSAHYNYLGNTDKTITSCGSATTWSLQTVNNQVFYRSQLVAKALKAYWLYWGRSSVVESVEFPTRRPGVRYPGGDRARDNLYVPPSQIFCRLSFVCTARTQMYMHVRDPKSVCRKTVCLTAGGMVTQKDCIRKVQLDMRHLKNLMTKNTKQCTNEKMQKMWGSPCLFSLYRPLKIRRFQDCTWTDNLVSESDVIIFCGALKFISIYIHHLNH